MEAQHIRNLFSAEFLSLKSVFTFFHGYRSIFMVCHGSWLVYYVSRFVFMVFHGSRSVFHGSRLVFMVFLVPGPFLWFFMVPRWFLMVDSS